MDFNCHHPAWGCPESDHEGEALLDSVEQLNFTILNDGSETISKHPRLNKSAIDITLSSHSLATKSAWQVIRDTHGSNHYPILIEVDIQQEKENIVINPRYKWNLKKADSKSINFSHTDNHINDYKKCIDIINDSANESIPVQKTIIINPYKNTPWWDDDCLIAENQTKATFKKFSKFSTYENFILCKKLAAKNKKIYKNKKKKLSWQNYASTINKDTPISEI